MPSKCSAALVRLPHISKNYHVDTTLEASYAGTANSKQPSILLEELKAAYDFAVFETVILLYLA